MSDQENFEAWFGSPLEALTKDSNAGFILAMTAFPLLERYLRRKTGCEPKQEPFREALLNVLPELKTLKNAEAFWGSYRHGLLHQVLLNAETDWMSHATPIIEMRPEGVWMNPKLFAERVLETIRGDFATFALPRALPRVKSVAVASGPGYGAIPVPPTVMSTGGGSCR